MKKFILSMVALVALTMVACGPNKAVEAQKKLYTEALAKMDSLNTLSDLATFQQDFAAAQSEFAAQNAEAMTSISEEDKAAISTLVSEWGVKFQAKADSLAAEAAKLIQVDSSALVVETATAL